MESKYSGATALGHKVKGVVAEGKEESGIYRTAEPKASHSGFAGSKCDSRSEKAERLERELDEEADNEFEALMRKPNIGTPMISENPHCRLIAAGLRINFMNMRDYSTGRLLWESDKFGADMFEREMIESVPASILNCRSVSREINFTSMETIENFRLEQRVFFQGQVLEEWLFKFGYVIRGSTNSWEHIIEAAPKDQMLPPELLSGEVTFETAFFNGDLFICKNLDFIKSIPVKSRSPVGNATPATSSLNGFMKDKAPGATAGTATPGTTVDAPKSRFGVSASTPSVGSRPGSKFDFRSRFNTDSKSSLFPSTARPEPFKPAATNVVKSPPSLFKDVLSKITPEKAGVVPTSSSQQATTSAEEVKRRFSFSPLMKSSPFLPSNQASTATVPVVTPPPAVVTKPKTSRLGFVDRPAPDVVVPKVEELPRPVEKINTIETRYNQFQSFLKVKLERSGLEAVDPIVSFPRRQAAVDTARAPVGYSARAPVLPPVRTQREQEMKLRAMNQEEGEEEPMEEVEGMEEDEFGRLRKVQVILPPQPTAQEMTARSLSLNQELDVAAAMKMYADRLADRKHFTAPTYSYSRKPVRNKPVKPTTTIKSVVIPANGLTLRELASKLSLKTSVLIEKLKAMGDEIEDADGFALGNRMIDPDIAELVVLEMGLAARRLEADDADKAATKKGAAKYATMTSIHPLVPRAPVVCIMGHVDHGKTTLLDALRKANVAASEAGGITQKLSAFTVEIKGKSVVFLDTPGHQAFSAMRSNGALATDVAVLVISMDDGVRPQTIEALKAAQEAGCHILVALSKIDRIPVSERAAARTRVLNQLVQLNLMAEEYGGDAPVVEVAAKTGEGIDNLVEVLSLQTEVLELTAPVLGSGEATVLDSNIEKGRGVVADVLVRWGTLQLGDAVVVGTAYGKVKAMTSDTGKALKSCPPSVPVRMLGLRTVPTAGQEMIVVSSELKAKEIAERRLRVQELRKQVQQAEAVREAAAIAAAAAPPELDAEGNPLPPPPSGMMAQINVVMKADGVGTLTALSNVVTGIKDRCKNVNVSIIASGVGDITRSDIERGSYVASSTAATCVLGFNVSASETTRQEAKEMDVEIRRDTVIYRLEDALTAIMESLLPKEKHMTVEGTAKVQQVFNINDKSGSVVAGLNVMNGRLRMSGAHGNFIYRVTRNSEVLVEEDGDQLKRFKSVVHEVEQGNECGLKLKSFTDFQADDLVECYRVEWKPRPLAMEAAVIANAMNTKPKRG